jgi:hypothetical protein
MRILVLFLLAVAPVHGIFAQTVYKQKTFVFSETESIQGDHISKCMEGVDFISRKYNYHDINPNIAYNSKISSIETWDVTGKVIDHEVKQIGDILICQDWQTYFPEHVIVPVYYEITIGERKYRAAGAGTSPVFPELDVLPGGGGALTPDGYPEFGVSNLSYTATVFPAADGKIGGMFYMGNLGFVDGQPREYYNHFGMGVLQVTVPFPTVEVDGQEWLQPAAFTGLSWNQIDAVCPSETGVCEGVLKGYNLSGWTWASVDDLNALFNHYIGSNQMGPGPDFFMAGTDSTWGTAFFDDGWQVTGRGFFPESRATAGALRELRDNGDAYEAMLSESVPGAWYPPPGDWDTPDPFDAVITSRGNPVDERYDSVGAWFYRDP